LRNHSYWHPSPFFFIFTRLKIKVKCSAILAAASLANASVMADEAVSSAGTNSVSGASQGGGLFDWLDPQSAYDQEFFAQPLLVDDTSLEKDGELEFSSLHTGADGQHSDTIGAEIQKSIGLLTLEVGVPYQRYSEGGAITEGIGNLDLGARCPVIQNISAKGLFDNTFGIGMELGIPVNSAVSLNTELEPKVFDDLKIGQQFSIQTVLGYSILFGGGGNGGQETFEYGVAFAYGFPADKLRLPGVQQLTPLFELVGEKGLNEDEAGQDSLLGSIGFRLDLKPLGELQPSLGLGYVFPFDNAAQAEAHWGIVISLIFEF